jgi:hypothetical protein
MLLRPGLPPAGALDQWALELKWDGMRAREDPGEVTARSLVVSFAHRISVTLGLVTGSLVFASARSLGTAEPP